MSLRKVVEPVPRSFVRRDGDWAQEGGNNTLIVMETDRASPGPATVDDGLGTVEAPGGGKGTGAIHLVAGRRSSDPDMAADDAFVYLSMKTQADDNLKLSANGATNSTPAAIVKSSAVRLVARQNIRIALDGEGSYVFIDADQIEIRLGESFLRVKPDRVTIEGGTIELGKGAGREHVNLGDTFTDAFLNHFHQTAVGPTSQPIGSQGSQVPVRPRATYLSTKSVVE